MPTNPNDYVDYDPRFVYHDLVIAPILKEDLYPFLGDRESIDASELGFKPGQWPAVATIGGNVYQRVRPEKSNGELVGWIYSTGKQDLMVFNESKYICSHCNENKQRMEVKLNESGIPLV